MFIDKFMDNFLNVYFIKLHTHLTTGSFHLDYAMSHSFFVNIIMNNLIVSNHKFHCVKRKY